MEINSEDNRTLAERTYEGKRLRFTVLSRSMVERFVVQEPHVVISITDPENPDARLAESDQRIAVIRLQFHDIGDYGQPLRNRIVMSDEDAEKILDFCCKYQHVSRIVCQCEAGMSRSAGIAAALSKIFQDEDRFFFANFAPNRWVYRTILDVHERRDFVKSLEAAE